MSFRAIGISVYGPLIPNTPVELQGVGKSVLGPNNYVSFSIDASWTDTHLFINAEGYEPYSHHVSLPLDGLNKDIILANDGPTGPNIINFPNLTPLHKPIIDLNQVFNPPNRFDREVIKGTDQFSALMKFNDGKDIDPLIKESQELGFNSWRILFMGSKKQNGYIQLDPRNAYPAMYPLCEKLIDNGIIPLVTVFADAQDIMPDVNDRRTNWTHIIDLLLPLAGFIMFSKGNQYKKNGWSPYELANPNLPWWSQGSTMGEQQNEPAPPPLPSGTFDEFHPRRDMPTMMLDSVASPVYLGDHGYPYGRLVISEPIGIGTQLGSSQRLDDSNIIWRLARHYATECPAAYCHTDFGIQSILMDDNTRGKAEVWQRGMNIK